MVPRTHTPNLPRIKDINEADRNKHIVAACNKVFSAKRSDMMTHDKHLFAGFAAINPQMSTDKIAMCIVLARHTLIKQIELEFHRIYKPEHKSKSKLNLEKWSSHMNTTMENVHLFSPSSRTLSRDVGQLAVDQALIVSDEVRDKYVFLQEDGGHNGQDVKFISYWIPDDTVSSFGSVKLILLDADTAGKSSTSVADGIKFSLAKVGITSARLV